MEVASLWQYNPRSLCDTLKIMKVPQNNLFSFYSACDALNLLGKKEIQTTREASRQSEEKTGLMQRILKRIWGNHRFPEKDLEI